jgi:Tfp pilus assembly protein PilF
VGEYDAAIKAAPTDGRLFYMRGRAYYKKREFRRAESDYRRALDLNPNMAKANREFGRLLMERGRYDAADMYLRKSVELDPAIRQSEALIARNSRERRSAGEGAAENRRK